MRTIFLACVLAVIAGALANQKPMPRNADVSGILHRMEGADRNTRKEAFRELTRVIFAPTDESSAEGHSDGLNTFLTEHPDQADSVRLGLIHLLSTENSAMHSSGKAGSRLTEDDTEYYAAVIATVGELKDERAIPALLGAASTGGMATRSVAAFGDKAVDPVLAQLKSEDPMARASALASIWNMLRLRTVTDPRSHARLKAAIRSSLADPAFVVRDAAVAAIEYLVGRAEFVPALRELAANDPFMLPGTSAGAANHYPVRFHAKRLLKKIENQQAPMTPKG